MTVESDDDRLALLADFGVDVEIGGKVITGILDNLWEDANGVSVNVPVLTVRTKDITDFSRGQVTIVNNVRYTSEEYRNDGLGITNIILQEI